MSDSMGSGSRASVLSLFNKKKGKKSKQEGDTPEKREARILLYMSRANVNPEADKATPRKGENGRPLNIFTGEEYTEEEVTGIEDDETEEE